MKKKNFIIAQAKESYNRVYRNIDKEIEEFENYISDAKNYNVIKPDIYLKLQDHIKKIKTNKKLYSNYDVSPLMNYLEYLNVHELVYKPQYNDMSYMAITLETGNALLERLGTQIAS